MRRPPAKPAKPARSAKTSAVAVVEAPLGPHGIPPAVVEAALLIASGASESKAAKATGLARSSLGRWLKRPGFDDAISSLKAGRAAEERRLAAEALVEVVVTGGSVAAAAKAAGIAVSTAYAYLREHLGLNGLAEVRALMEELVAAQRASVASRAVESLYGLVPKLEELVVNGAEVGQVRAAALTTLRDLAAMQTRAPAGAVAVVSAKAAAGGPGGAAAAEVRVDLITPPPMSAADLPLDKVEAMATLLLGGESYAELGFT